MEDIAIEVKNVSKIYRLYDRPIDRLKEAVDPFKKKYHKEFYALSNVNFEVKRGETVGIIGKNGSGKSTLLKLITGVLTPNSGKIEVVGRVSALLELGAGFNPEFTGVENIYLNGTMMGYSKEDISKKVDSILDFADIGDFVSQPVKTYSSGMFARLAFAVAINVEPDILIVDEALSVGDVFFQNKCFRKFEELKDRGTTILFVSHDLGSVKQMCSRVLWLDEGNQKLFDVKDKVCSAYFNEQFEVINKMNKDIIMADIEDTVEIVEYKDEIRYFPKIKAIDNNISSDSVKIISFFIKDSNGNMTEHLYSLECYTFHIVAQFYDYMKDLIFGFVLENSKGINILALNTYISEEKVFNSKKGDIIETIFKVKLPKIMKGEYLISPAVAQGNQKNHVMLTWLHNILKVSIDNSGYNLSLIEIDGETELYKYDEEHIKLYD